MNNAEQEARRKAIRDQILRDQASGAKRDERAWKREQEWHREQTKKDGK